MLTKAWAWFIHCRVRTLRPGRPYQEALEKATGKKPLKLGMAGFMSDTGRADRAADINSEVISGGGWVPASRNEPGAKDHGCKF